MKFVEKRDIKMIDTPNNTRRWQMPRPSAAQLLAIALALSLILSGYLLSRLNERAQASSLTYPVSPPSSSTLHASPDIGVLMAQLQEMQTKLQATNIQLEQKSQSAGVIPSGSATQIPLADEDLPALWAEIEQLYQVMQPLMVQVETATATRSSRSVSELAALRTQVNAIHQRLAYLLTRAKAAKARANAGSGRDITPWATPAGLPANPTSPDQVMFEQLYQNMTELQNMLQQMPSQGTNP